MWVRYRNHLVNMDTVTDFFKSADFISGEDSLFSITFLFPLLDKDKDFVETLFSFESQEERDVAFEKIHECLIDYERVCDL